MNQRKARLVGNIIAASVLVAAFILMSLSQKKFSPVYDEIANIPGGYNFIKTGRYTDPTHPPLIRYLLAIPLYLHGDDPMPSDTSALYRWQTYGTHFLFQNNRPWYNILSDARTVIILLSVLLLALVYRWTALLWGQKPALIAILLLAFEPSFLGHGQLATLDMGFSLAYFGATWLLWKYINTPNWRNFWLLHLLMGIAFMSKFAAVPLMFAGLYALLRFRKSQQIPLRHFLFSPIIFAGIIFAAYLFQVSTPADDIQITKARESVNIQNQLDKVAADIGTTRQNLLSLPVPAYDFWKGFGMQVFHTMFQDIWEKKESFQYLNGRYSRRGWHTYFCWTFALKSTVGSILIVIIALGFMGGRYIKQPKKLSITATCLLVSPLLLFLFCSAGTINIGHRYILPIYPFIAMGAGYLMAKWSRAKLILLPLLALHILSSLSVWPFHLSYFNEFSRNGYYLADSNIDWGQDLLWLKKDIEQPAIKNTSIWGDCFGVVKPSDFGIDLKPIPLNNKEELGKGRHTIYLSIHRFLNKSSVHPDGLYPWMNELYPTRKVGTSILVYDVEVP